MNLRWMVTLSVGIVLAFAAGTRAYGHFPWLAVDQDGKALYFFGETIAQRDYKIPEKLTSADVRMIALNGDESSVPMSVVESDSYIGRVSNEPISNARQLISQVTFGIYGGARLDYYTQHVIGSLPTRFDDFPSSKSSPDLQCVAIRTNDGVTIRATWKGKPVIGSEVKLFCEEGHEEGNKKTNDDGEVTFSNKQIEEGLNGIMLGVTRDDEPGKIGDREYKTASHYLTLTFVVTSDAKKVPKTHAESASSDKTSAVTRKPSDSDPFPPMPLTLTSFGATRIGDQVFVYGGHTGEAHHYSTAEQSDALMMLDLANPIHGWKTISNGRRLQGLGLVSHNDRVIRVGGFEAMNKLDEDHDLRSSDEVMAFNLKSKAWESLPNLPEPRSSHDALIVGDRLYVVGGWTLRGEETEWLTTAWSMDLSASNPRWEAMPNPNFVRRAVALAAWDSKLFVIGGMGEKGGPTAEVSYFDFKDQAWHSGPAINGRAMNGFGAAAWPVNNALVTTTIDGDIQRLKSDLSAWETIGKTRDARFFHRLIPHDGSTLLAIGGANMEHGKFPNVEVISLR